MAEEVKWTDEQKQAIYEKDSNILVAAAAGSGKTAVLVERIINKIINEKNICNVTYVLQKYTDNRFVLNLTTETKEFENDISSINYDTNPKKENHKIIVKNDIVEDRIYLAA